MVMVMVMMMKRYDDHEDNGNDDKLTFSDNEEAEKQDHGVTREDEVAAIFLKIFSFNFDISKAMVWW